MIVEILFSYYEQDPDNVSNACPCIPNDCAYIAATGCVSELGLEQLNSTMVT